MTPLRAISTLAALAALGAMRAAYPMASAGPCRSEAVGKDTYSAYLERFIARIADIASEDPNHPAAHELRIADSLPLLKRSEVRVEKRRSACQDAIAAVDRANRDLIDAGTWKKAKSVIVLRAGDVYVVQDPDQYTGEWMPTYVFDKEFTRVKVVLLF